ncbi:GGDEF domain-containing protein [Devosia limi]|uniref:diguanylate cyclase n=1 Tax=Devosia limi DSM 17137 TaxID=1121477 RepID=A0A1M5AKP4_9HYPH|nr:GGDEF domain-containing protein [Devosia limi]SHF30472.1 diguanylate cyclase (GGDEF) domain-containing protein [Devosia limi DSM 17137]
MPDELTDTSRLHAQSRQLLAAGRCVEALAATKIVFADAEAAGDITLMAHSLSQIAWCCMKLGQAEFGLECALGARRLWERADHPAELARAAAIEAFLLIDIGLSDEAFQAAESALQIAETALDDSVTAFACNAKAVALVICRQPELAAPLLERAIALASAAGAEAERAFCLHNLGFCHIKQADDANHRGEESVGRYWLDLAIENADAAIDAARACGDLWTLRAALANGAEFQGLRGDLYAASRYLNDWAALPGDPGPSLHIHFLYTQSDILLRSGLPERARIAAAEALALAEASSQTDHLLNAVARLSAVHEAMGDFATALALHQRFHALYVAQSGEVTRRQAKVAEIRFESEHLRARTKELTGQVMQDPLTGIANRRSFDHILDRLAGTGFAVAIVDLDFFKAVNDRFSHLVGDAVLQLVARILVANIGVHGHAARLGGEEFALIFPDAAIANAAAFCDTVRLAVAEADWAAIAPGLRVTVSIGLAAGGESDLGGDLLAIADRRLYAAKAQGRNRLVTHDGDALHPATSRRQFRAG